MLRLIKYGVINLILFSTFFGSTSIKAQSLNTKKFQYLSPVPNSKLNSKGTNIIIKPGYELDGSLADKPSSIIVDGNKSGKHSGKIILAESNRTLIFKPYEKFADGETVTVRSNNLKTVSGKQIPNLSYSFEISAVDLNEEIKSNPENYPEFLSSQFGIEKKFLRPRESFKNFYTRKTYTIQQDSLPEDFPEITVDSINNPSPGYIFLAPFGYPKSIESTYLIITDNYGVPVFYKRTGAETAHNFKKQANGLLTYFQITKDYVMDSSYNIVDSLTMRNGYSTDLHECLVLKNGYSFLMCYDRQRVRMDTIVEGGNFNALVNGIVIQELDENKNVIFQWRTWDHFKITDATYDVNLTGSTVDYVHSNAIEMDNDGNLLLSSRHLDEVTKIDIKTGDIIWRLGGKYCENNQFAFTNDSIGFSHQHDVRRLANGNITVFDNGNLHSPAFSRAVEYQIDEINKTATLVREYKNDPKTHSVAMGSNQRLDNNNMLVGWGLNHRPPAISEITPSEDVTLYLNIPDTLVSYRAFKYSWKTNLFVTNPDSIFFKNVSVGDSLIQSLDIINNSDKQIEINGLLNRDSVFTVVDSLPIIIDALDTLTIQVKFKPKVGTSYSDDLHLQWNSKNERIAQIVHLSGTTVTSVETNLKKTGYSLSQNYPNPFNPSTKISFSIPERGKVLLEIYDILGHKIKTLINEEMNAGNYKVEFNTSSAGNEFPSGVYFYRLKINKYVNTKKMILLK